jgi:hypothetical protein
MPINTKLRTRATRPPYASPAPLSAVKIINSVSLSILIVAICLPGTFFAARALMPSEIQDSLYASLLRHSAFAEAVSIAFVVVLNLGVPMCAAALILNLILVLPRGLPLWLKLAMTLFVLVAILGTLFVRSAVHFPTRP